jgi:hypothetical protein
MVSFRKKARNLPVSFKKSDDFIGLQLKMWQILPKKIPKIPWTMLLGPNFFTKMAKICHKKITELHHSIL